MSEQFWSETDCGEEINKVLKEFNISGTKFVWPVDRQVCFVIDEENNENTTIPVFSLKDPQIGYDNIQGHVRSYVDFCVYTLEMEDPTALHLHLIEIEGRPDLLGMYVAHGKHKPVTDFFRSPKTK